MNENIFLLIILLMCVIGLSYQCFLVWFRFPKYRERLIKRNESYQTRGWPFARGFQTWASSNVFMWLTRITALLFLLLTVLAFLWVSWSQFWTK